MNFYLIIFICFFLITFTNQGNISNYNVNDTYLNDNFSFNDNDKSSFNTEINLDIQDYLNRIINSINATLNSSSHSDDYVNCFNNIMNYYHYNDVNNSQRDILEKIYEGSSKGFIDLSGFYNCINMSENEDERFNFYTIYPNLTKTQKKDINIFNDISLEEDLWIFGFCLKDKLCNETALKELFQDVNSLFNNTFNYSKSNIKIIDNLKSYDDLSKKNLGYILWKSSPFITILIQILFIVVKIIPVKIFGCCIKYKYKRELKNEPKKKINYAFDDNKRISKKINSKIKECFSFFDNLNEFIYNKKENDFSNNEELYIKGVRFLGICFFIFGTTFIYFFNYPICISEKEEKTEYMKSFKTLLLIIFWRTAPALLLSASGYTLSYKFLNFLDRKLAYMKISKFELQQIKDDNEDEEEKLNIIDDTEKNNNTLDLKQLRRRDEYSSGDKDTSQSKSYTENTVGIKFYQNNLYKKTLNKMFKDQTISESGILSKISTTKIEVSLYFNFIFRQIHKFFGLNLGIAYFKYFFPMILIINNPGAPLMNYLLTEIIGKMDYGIGYFLIYRNIGDLFSHQEDDNKGDKINILQIFSLIICECNFFIIGSIFIFICYKKQYRLDIIIYVLLFLLLIFKIVFILLRKGHSNPGMFYFDSDYQRFFFNPAFNFDYYLIGMLFGMVNYVLQNEIAKKEQLIKERPMVKIPTYLSKLCDYNRSGHYIHFICSMIFFIIFFTIFPILFSINFKDIILDERPPLFFLIISSIDVDFFIYLFHFFMISCYISGRNSIFKLFNANMWSQYSKLYFWVIIFTPLINYYIIYKTETQLNLSFLIVLIYGAICGANLYVISLLFFVIIEMPYKRLIKLYFNIHSILNKSNEDDDDDNEKEDKKNPLHSDTFFSELNEKGLEDIKKGTNSKDNRDEEEDKLFK